MKKHSSIFLFICLAVIFPVLAFGLVHWYQNNVDELPYYGKDYQLANNTNEKFVVGDFKFEDQNQQLFDSQKLKGKVWVANYFFSNCKTICPILMPNMRVVEKAFDKNSDVQIVSFTVDPERDSAQQLHSYSQIIGIENSTWHLLTGSKLLLYRYARNQLFVTASDGDGGADDFIHSDKVALIDRSGHIRGYYEGTDKKDIQNLIRDIKKIL
ncbi:SCO family protein [Rhizosphaericola mali]|uniref:SCO family protein n=1 Tax=Rhizosphaericola mali TaxID=2545455 RepID=A0A5P2G2F3_9BACT|nr:SCO family protein [Rhizosphaericola mali]QES89367.1 SCO family protein [Rhizosphaericola mali]